MLIEQTLSAINSKEIDHEKCAWRTSEWNSTHIKIASITESS